MKYIGNAFPSTHIRDLNLVIKNQEIFEIADSVRSKDLATAVRNKWILPLRREFKNTKNVTCRTIGKFDTYKRPVTANTPQPNKPQETEVTLDSIVSEVVRQIVPKINKTQPTESLTKNDVLEIINDILIPSMEPHTGSTSAPGLTKEDVKEMLGEITGQKQVQPDMSSFMDDMKNLIKNIKVSDNKTTETEYNEDTPMFIPKIETGNMKKEVKSKKAIDTKGLAKQLEALKKLKNK